MGSKDVDATFGETCGDRRTGLGPSSNRIGRVGVRRVTCAFVHTCLVFHRPTWARGFAEKRHFKRAIALARGIPRVEEDNVDISRRLRRGGTRNSIPNRVSNKARSNPCIRQPQITNQSQLLNQFGPCSKDVDDPLEYQVFDLGRVHRHSPSKRSPAVRV
jgi:hypothetical protein